MIRVNQKRSKSEPIEEVLFVTDMKRTTISLPDELADRIFALRKDDRFTRCSYSELIRQLAERGLSMLETERDGPRPSA